MILEIHGLDGWTILTIAFIRVDPTKGEDFEIRLE